MAIKFEKIAPGMVLFDIHRERMGNTTIGAWGKWSVKIISVDVKKQTAMVQWNDNAPEKWHRRQLERLYTKETKAYREQRERRARGNWF